GAGGGDGPRRGSRVPPVRKMRMAGGLYAPRTFLPPPGTYGERTETGIVDRISGESSATISCCTRRERAVGVEPVHGAKLRQSPSAPSPPPAPHPSTVRGF